MPRYTDAGAVGRPCFEACERGTVARGRLALIMDDVASAAFPNSGKPLSGAPVGLAHPDRDDRPIAVTARLAYTAGTESQRRVLALIPGTCTIASS